MLWLRRGPKPTQKRSSRGGGGGLVEVSGLCLQGPLGSSGSGLYRPLGDFYVLGLQGSGEVWEEFQGDFHHMEATIQP